VFVTTQLEYLAMFLKETLRVRPPVSQTGAAGRTVTADEGVVLGGYVIPKGVTVSPSIAALNYDEKYAGLDAAELRNARLILE
jgi:cytochrome P450